EAAEGGVLGQRADLAQQHRVAGQAEDVADTLALALMGSSKLGTDEAAYSPDDRPSGGPTRRSAPTFTHRTTTRRARWCISPGFQVARRAADQRSSLSTTGAESVEAWTE